MGIFFDQNPKDGSVRFYHETTAGPRQIAAPLTEKERKAGKRPKMIDNPDCRIPKDAKPISQAAFDKLFAAQAEGKAIVMRKGKPVAVDHKPDPEHHEALRRRKRDKLLAASDWTQLSDSPLSAEQKEPWIEYRQKLRDLDMTATDWPTAPTLPAGISS